MREDGAELRLVRRACSRLHLDQNRPHSLADVDLGNSSTYELLQQLEDSLLALNPADPRDRWWLGQAMTLAAKIGDTGWLLAQQVGQGTPKAFVALLVFWLTLLFASFGLFAPRNFTSAMILTLCALAVGGAIGMLLELEKGFGGLIHNSPQPMLQAVKALEYDGRVADRVVGRTRAAHQQTAQVDVPAMRAAERIDRG